MKHRIILLALFSILAFGMKAQSTIPSVDGKRIYFIHVLLQTDGKYKDKAILDNGTRFYAFSKNPDLLLDEKGEPVSFKSKLALINYMTLQGWTYMDTVEDMYETDWKTFAKELTEEEAKKILPTLIN